ncbi:LOW QUALITY PROTEIN: rho guanine nucleotide exchange factor 28-like [Oncorhynchus masou masou]|uniref:LOW QUALITY PROTEIN: rho guanine nucleotide exchange factor 28-like n=1 Tax=Oncorhynchus masou masou TaxID=90313 RepID=UPI003182F510
MELNRGEVPLYGQVEVRAVLQVPDLDREPEQTEFYVVLEGSKLAHVAVVKRAEDGESLCFTVPGHDLQETASVTVYRHTEDGAKPCGGGASLRYVCDLPQKVAEYLLANSDSLSPQSHLEVLRRVSAASGEGDMEGDMSAGPGKEHSLGQTDQEEEGVRGGRPRPDPQTECHLREMDERITQAVANLNYPLEWSGKASQPREELLPREALLHLSVRLGLLHLSRFLIGQPMGQRALTMPNEEGETPLQLAQRRGDHSLFMALATSPFPQRSPLVGVWCVWADSTRVLRFCPGSDCLSLTFLGGPESSVLGNILVLREKLMDHNILRQISALRGDVQMEDSYGLDVHRSDASDGGLGRGLPVRYLTLVDSVFEDQLVLSLDDDEELPTLQTVKSQTTHPRGTQRQFSHSAAADTLASIINGRSQLDTEVDDLRANVSVAGITRDSSVTVSRVWDSVASECLLQATSTPLPPLGLEEQQSPSVSHSPSPSPSPADRALARLNSNSHSYLTNQRGSPPLESPDLSPSLVALVMDSEGDEEGFLVKTSLSPISPLTSDPRSSGDDTSPDLTCTRTHSASSDGEPPLAKDMGNQGIRHRSYSYSSPKISLLPPRFSRKTLATPATSDLSPEQRTFSLSEQPLEKRELRFRKRAQSADDEGSVELAESLQHLTLSEFLKEIEEEEWDKYNIPSKVESEKYKVIRTFSFLKSRMSTTRNKNKGKGKEKEREKGKEKEREKEGIDKDKQQNGHRFSTGSCAGPTVCLVCDKPATGKDLLHCSCCTVMVHKGCKDSAPPCLKKLQDKYAVTMVKNRTASLPQNFTVRDSPSPCPISTSASLPMMSQRDKRETASLPNPLSRSVPSATDRLSESPEAESDSRWCPGQSEELLQTTESSTSTDSSVGEDCVDASLHGDLDADALDYKAESWSLTVEHTFCKKQDKRVVKRQDVIYELMQTEMHHLQTLRIMAEVFRRGMREEVQLDAGAVDRVFPCLDELLLLHHNLFNAMRERRHSSAKPHGDRNYVIVCIGDILLQQFSEDSAERMKQVYGEFCSHHTEAVTFFKELQQHNKRFQTFIKQQSNNYLVRRREIPECILLVTQRITKYPVLLERILQYTQVDSEEHMDLSRALVLIKEVIAAVDLMVSEFEQGQRLQDVLNRMENRSFAKLKNGHTFRKQDVLGPGQTLKHQGLLLWKTATGRLKDVMALLLTNTLIFLQEKDQKFIFAAVDQKPPVISLQKLIVREVANEERGMFLISASAAGPEMYEVHTSSKDERNTWMRLIREAVESCPEEEEENTNESEEERRTAEARVQKIHKLQETLSSQDYQICSSLEEKLQIYAELSVLRGEAQEPHPEPHLLVQPNPEEVPQAAGLLTAALREAENLRTTLSSLTFSPFSPCSPPRDPLSHPVSPAPSYPLDTPSDAEASLGDPNTRDGESASQVLVLQSLTNNINLKVSHSVQSLIRLLYSLQAAVTIQDSFYEVQKFLLHESDRHSPRSPRPHTPCLRGNALQEQEKQRNLEKRREEVAAAVRLQGRLHQERQRWERECQARHSQQGELESRLEERERQCHLEAERLKQEREELEEQLEEYQQSLERLRESQRSVEKERERLETQQNLLQSWRHSRQRSLPVMVIPLDRCHQDSLPGQPGGHLDNGGSVFVNEAAVTMAIGLNNRHVHHHLQQQQRGYGDDPRAHNSLNTLLARSSHGQTLQLHPDTHTPRDWAGGTGVTGYLYTPTEGQGSEQKPNDINTHRKVRETWSLMATAAGQYQGVPPHGDPQLELSFLVPLETESGDGEDVGEENIVYL